MLSIPLPYPADGADLFERIADEPWAMFLDSAGTGGALGRYDILVARPRATLIEQAGVTTLWQAGKTPHAPPRQTTSLDDPLDLLRATLGLQSRDTTCAAPFAGGAVGYFAYELGQRLMSLPNPPTQCLPADPLPRMAVGLYDWAVVIDHATRTCYLQSDRPSFTDDASRQSLVDLFTHPQPTRPARTYHSHGAVENGMPYAAYLRAHAKLKRYIRAGDCYQANLTQPFGVRVTGDPWAAYRRLRQLSPTPFAAYLNLPWAHVLSASPERFLQLRDGQVSTRPIKGTRRRDTDAARDAILKQELAASAKDRAENLMIVDLLRNDLGKVCQPGSIQVPELFAIESYANVHHLVSSIRGRLAPGEDALSLLRACFPGGSITGAPKRRAMQVIGELETTPRGIYCGSIGYIGHHGDMDGNIAIRTLTWQAGHATFNAGGGIVADSDAASEYQECRTKAAPMFALMDDARVG